ncbi:MAG: DUF2807 domain-containing protein [Bacteroidetes bacterium]|nr:DUF2807 domain-containing protein [Bacteroidota bacterium]
MKKYIVLVTFLCGFFAIGQGLLERNVGDFHEIKVYDLIAVNLTKSNENKFLIKGPHANDIQFINKDGVLKVRMMLDKKFQGENTFVEVYYKDLDVIDGNEGARINANELISQTSLSLRVQEGAEIRLGLKVNYLSSKAVTGGVIEASGTVDVHDVNMNTGAILRAKELRSSITNIRLTAGGEAAIFATKRVDINVRAGGDVDVYGNPKEVTKKQFAGGRIRFRS